eukprot:m.108195 g.108195  ORF g.108195 m.108195 type:complete len:372 (+) comp13954_c0_seq1:86-1201(+)
MRWATALWDQRGRLEQYTGENIENVEQYRSFATALAQAEMEYSKSLRAVHKRFAAFGQQDNTSAMQTWRSILKGVETVAAAHEQTSITLAGDIQEHLKQAAKSKAQERAQIMQELAKLDANLQQEMATMNKITAKYEKVKKDSDAAFAAFDKAEKADNVTKAKVEKAKATWVQKAKATDAIKVELDQEQRRIRDIRVLHYKNHCPSVIDQLEACDQNLWEAIVKAYHKIAMCFNYVRKSNEEAAQGIAEKAKAFSKSNDSALFATLVLGGRQPTPMPSDTDPEEETAQQPMVSPTSPQPDQEPEAEEEEPAASTQQCRILYDFAGSNDGELGASANEVLNLLTDDGSGWILVAKPDTLQQGYVPSTYIEKI